MAALHCRYAIGWNVVYLMHSLIALHQAPIVIKSDNGVPEDMVLQHQ